LPGFFFFKGQIDTASLRGAQESAAWSGVDDRCGMARRAIVPKFTSKSAAALAGAARRKVGHCRAFLF